jgi:glycosyltransferase involved in cell wall biosynthesis
MSAGPTCTVAIPVYNRKEMLSRTIASALNQSGVDLEVVAIDDGSTDGAWELLEGLRDPRLRVVRNRANLGLFGNFNRCVELSSGKYLRILCNDDRLIPGCLQREIAWMEANPSLVLLCTIGRLVDLSGRPLAQVGAEFAPGVYEGPKVAPAILVYLARYGINPITAPSGVLFRREAILKAGPFDETFRVAGDLDLYLRMLSFGDLGVLHEVDCEIAFHEGQVSRRLRGDPGVMREVLALTRGCRAALRKWGAYEWSIRRLAAFAYLGSLLLTRRDRQEDCREMRAIAHEAAGRGWAIALPAAGLVWDRVVRRAFGVRIRPRPEPFVRPPNLH